MSVSTSVKVWQNTAITDHRELVVLLAMSDSAGPDDEVIVRLDDFSWIARVARISEDEACELVGGLIRRGVLVNTNTLSASGDPIYYINLENEEVAV